MTFSIAAVDLATHEVGAAAASCIAPSEVSIVYGPVPGRGVVIAQSYLHDGTLARGVSALAAGTAPDDVMASLLDPVFDPEGDKRQLAVLDLQGDVAVFTGRRALAFASHRRFVWGTTVFTVEGNRLTGAAVLDRMAGAFMQSDAATGCDLAGKLVGALLAAPATAEGDARCTGTGIPADSAFVGVELTSGPPLRITSTQAGVDPLPEIARAFAAHRAAHPCPGAPPTDGAGGSDGDGGEGGHGGEGDDDPSCAIHPTATARRDGPAPRERSILMHQDTSFWGLMTVLLATAARRRRPRRARHM